MEDEPKRNVREIFGYDSVDGLCEYDRCATIEWKDRSQSDEVGITGSKFKEKVFIRKQVGLADGAEWKKGRKHCEWRSSDACVPLPPTIPWLLFALVAT